MPSADENPPENPPNPPPNPPAPPPYDGSITCVAELVILCTFLRVGENVVCLVYLLELGFSLRIIGVKVGVILLGELTVGFLISSSVAPFCKPSTS